MDNLDLILTEELQKEFLDYLKEDPEFESFEFLNEEVLTEGKLLNKIRWKLALFSLKFLSEETLNNFFSVYYSKNPEKIKNTLRMSRKDKYKLLRKITNDRLSDEQREKIANCEAAKKCEKAAALSGISTGISALSTTFSVARAANATSQYIASKKDAEVNQQNDKTDNISKEEIKKEDIKKEDIKKEEIKKEEINSENPEKEEIIQDSDTSKSDNSETKDKAQTSQNNEPQKVDPKSVTEDDFERASNIVRTTRGDVKYIGSAKDIEKVYDQSNDLYYKVGNTYLNAEHGYQVTIKDGEMEFELPTGFDPKNIDTDLSFVGGEEYNGKEIIAALKICTNIENQYEGLENALDNSESDLFSGKNYTNLTRTQVEKISKYYIERPDGTISFKANVLDYMKEISSEPVLVKDTATQKMYAYPTFNLNSSRSNNTWIQTREEGGEIKLYSNWNPEIGTNNQQNPVDVQCEIRVPEDIVKQLNLKNGDTVNFHPIPTGSSSSSGEAYITNGGHGVFINGYLYPIANKDNTGRIEYYTSSNGDTKLLEAMSQEKKENVKTGIQLFISALTALATTVFPLICGPILGGVVASGVIAAGAAVNTGFGAARTAKLTKKATTIRRDEIMAELLKNKDMNDLKECLELLNGNVDSQLSLIEAYKNGDPEFYNMCINIKESFEDKKC